MSGTNKLGRVKLVDVRLSYPYLYRPDTQTNDRGEVVKTYRASFIACPDDPYFKQNKKAISRGMKEVAEDRWGNRIPKLKADRKAARPLDAEDHYEGKEGCVVVSARAKEEFRPALVDNRKGSDGRWLRLENDTTNRLYPGCRVNAVVTFWAQDDPNYGKRINAVLESVQFRADDEPFGDFAPVNPDDAFGDDDVPEEALEDDGFDDDDDEDLDPTPARRRRSADDDDDDML